MGHKNESRTSNTGAAGQRAGAHLPVTISKTGKALYYGGKVFRSLKGAGFQSNYCDAATGDAYGISGPRRGGDDRLYGERVPTAIDEDVQEEYWASIRGLPERVTKNIVS